MFSGSSGFDGDGIRERRQCFQDRVPSAENSLEPGSSSSNVCPLVFNNPYSSLSVQQQRTRLPIFKNRNHILYLLEKYQTLIVVGETGCGKSTQIPQYLCEAGWATDDRIIGITEPRRVAAVSLANRVAEEKMSILGQEVGYVVRFDDFTDASLTKIKYMTDGILVREILSDPLLTRYSVLMVDEAHERSLNTDIILGLLRKIIKKRPDLRIVVSSATLDAELFRDFFNLNASSNKEKDTAAILSVEGRMYPVHIFYAKTPLPNYVKAAVNTVVRIHKREPPGDILVFLTGQDEVGGAVQMLKEESKSFGKNFDRLWVLPMYGALPAKEQFKVFDSSPAGTRKVVLATNIAEASVTIPGVAYVIDSGFVKLRALNSKNGLESEYEKLPAATVPEIQRSHLSPVILQLKALGVDNVLRFHYVSRPTVFAMIGGLELLFALGALDRSGHLTKPLGFQMAEFPLPSMHAKALLCSGQYRTVREDYPMKVHRGSVIMYREDYPQWVIFNEVLQDSMRDITVIDANWLYELAPHYYEYGTSNELASKRARVDREEDGP